jgi:uncharacterized membrane protein YphA (DoxX/SURF4 family)
MSNALQWLRHPATIRVAQVGIGLIFVAAGLAKVGDLRTFAEQIHNFRMVPVATEHLLAMTLPWIELVAGMALIVGIRVRDGALLTFVLMAVFTAGVALALTRGLDIECGCFGTTDASRVGLVKLLQNFGMLALAAIACLRPSHGSR